MSRRSSVSTHSSLDVAEPRRATSVLGITSVALGGLAAIATFTAWPFPTTVPVWIALLVGSSIWCLGAWIKVLSGLGRVEGYAPVPQEYGEKIHRRERRGMRWVLGGVTVVLVAVACVGVVPPKREMPERRQTQEPVLIAANLYNVEGIWDAWREEIVSLITHLGKNTTYLSIYESNSSDATPHLLALLSSSLTSQGIAHRIISERTPGRHWPHSASAERIAYLAHARNRALEPLASEDPEVRVLAGTAWEEEGKVVFLNDVVFEARQVVELLESRLEGELESEVDAGGGGAGGYDLACGMDYGWSGMYDTWVARDACGTPLRPFWPYVQDPVSVEKVRREEVFQVASCWNGVVVFRAGLVASRGEAGQGEEASGGDAGHGAVDGGKSEANGGSSAGDAMGGQISDGGERPSKDDVAGEQDPDGDVDALDIANAPNGSSSAINAGKGTTGWDTRTLRKRGWQMVDNATDPQSRYSPPVQLPLSFRTSHLDACDHSECFLFSYDLHRLYPTKERPPRILMNPRVKVAYERRWWIWHNIVLEIPAIKLWIRHWSRGYPLMFVDWIWESAGRRRDYCTWAGLSPHLPERCPALPGAGDRSWDQG